MKQILFVAAAFILTGTILTGCSKNMDYTPPATTQVLFANLSARNPSLDFYAGTSSLVKVASAISYQASSGYLTAVSGLYGVVADTSGQTDNYPVIAQLVPVGSGSGNSVFLVDSSATETRAVVTTDYLNTISADSVGIRCYHFSPDAPKLDFYIRNTTTPDFTRNFLYKNTTNENVNALSFTRFLKGDYTISIREAGTTTELYSLQVSLTGSKQYTLYTSGFISKPGTAQAFKAGLVLQDVK